MNLSKEIIESGQAYLGIELGSTRIKAVLIDKKGTPLAEGGYGWENSYINGIWTYSLDEVWAGLKGCYSDLCENVLKEYGVCVTNLSGIGISAMMHGYLVFDKDMNQLVPFRTWRNTITEQASLELTELMNFNTPQRWGCAHYYQAILNKEEHVPEVKYLTTLSAYIHFCLTGENVIGIDDASGMFPIGDGTYDYDETRLKIFNEAAKKHGVKTDLKSLLPKPLRAGERAGVLTSEGAKLLDPTGALQSGIRLCPPEGDAGTGMVATNAVSERNGNVSAGTSIFGLLVLEKPLSKVYKELELLTTPSGKPVAMAHCNNCSTDINSYMRIFAQFAEAFDFEIESGKLYETLFNESLKADPDCGGLLTYNFDSGEHIVGLNSGVPMLMRKAESKANLANLMRSLIYSSMATLKIGMDIMLKEEKVKADKITGHGGLFKTEGVAQQYLADALSTPIAVMKTAGEGGAWGIALLAAYLDYKDDLSLEDYLADIVFEGDSGKIIEPDKSGVDGFNTYISRFKSALPAEEKACESFEL